MANPNLGQEELQEMFDPMRGDDPDAESGDMVMEFNDEPSEIEDTPDGGAIVTFGGKPDDGPMGNSEFFDNLLMTGSGVEIDDSYLSTLAADLLESIEIDMEDRKPRDEQYEEGLRRTGMANDAPGGAGFTGATKVTHPILSTAAVDYEARVIKEIMPAEGPVKDHIPGTPTKERLEKAKRKVRHLNWQLTKQIIEFRSGLEQILTQEPIAGVCYQRWRWDYRMKRASAVFVPVDKMIIPQAATDFYTAERRTFIEDITEFAFKERVKDGIYIDSQVTTAGSMPPQKSAAEDASDKIEGKVPDNWFNKDGLRRIYEIEVTLDLSEWDDEADGEARPYILRICESSKTVLGIIRNWHPEKNPREPLVWTIEWPFVPWRGAMPVGLIHLMGGIPGALTGALRALLDSAHVNNVPTAVKLKGSKQGGQTLSLNPGEIAEIDGGVTGDDIRKVLMPVPFNEPSPVLFQLMGFLAGEGRGVVRTSMEDMAEQQRGDLPVGTTLALIEQGMAVMSAVHARQYVSMARSISVLCRLNAMYQEDEELKDEVGEVLARASDYQGPEDVIPVADPRIFSEAQRFAQAQVVAQRADGPKGVLYNARKVELMLLQCLRIPNPEQLLIAPPEPKELNAANENVAATLGRPITAFPEQEHLAHIQAHLDYLQSPHFGMNPLVAPKFLPLMTQHLIEHTTLWYANRVYELASASAGRDFSDFMEYKDAETKRLVDEIMAIAGEQAIEESKEVFEKITPIVQQAMAMMQQFAQNAMPQDPQGQTKVAVANINAQTKAADRQSQIQLRMQELKMRAIEGGRKLQADAQTTQVREAGQMQRQQTQIAADARSTAFTQQAETQRTQANNESREFMNTQDNETALTIAQSEIQSGEKIAVSTGTGINP